MPERAPAIDRPAGQDCLANELEVAVSAWDRRRLPRPSVVVVTGSGFDLHLGNQAPKRWQLESLLPFASHSIEGHALTYELAPTEALGEVLVFRGRLHAYQGFRPPEVVFCVRLAGLLGAHTLIVTNAAGGIYPDARPGDLAMISDQINLTGLNPLRGRLPPDWGPQFPDMEAAYDPGLRRCAREAAAALEVPLRSGVYVGVLGPSFETPAEIEAFRRLGADLVGMSTVLEVIAARHLGMRCFGLSLVTNPAVGTQQAEAPIDHQSVLEVGRLAAPRVDRLLGAMLADPELRAAPTRG